MIGHLLILVQIASSSAGQQIEPTIGFLIFLTLVFFHYRGDQVDLRVARGLDQSKVGDELGRW